MKKICPTCKREFTEIDNFCTNCGIELIKEPNRCSEMKTALCRNKVFKDEDKYCSICGSKTTYWKPQLDEIESW